MREIGSEFWDIPVCETENRFFPEDSRYFLSGRMALRYIICDIKERCRLQNAALPSWCCESMVIPFLDAGISVVFYPVFPRDGMLAVDLSCVMNCDALLIMDYFGYSLNWPLIDYNGIVIRDLTHSIFSRLHDDADYFFGSLRKWCGFRTGGIAWSRGVWHAKDKVEAPSSDYVEMRKKAMSGKAAFILGRSDERNYLSWFSEAETILDRIHGIQCADTGEIEQIKKLDIISIKKKRRNNAKRLLESLSEYAIFPQMSPEDCPMFVPILVPKGKRDEMRQYLIRKKIYCPIHWPLSRFHRVTEKVRFLYENELSIVCDQRYSAEDMAYVCEKIQAFWER